MMDGVDPDGFPDPVPADQWPYRIVVEVTPSERGSWVIVAEWPEQIGPDLVAHLLQLSSELVIADSPGVTASGHLIGEVREL